jgi:hypothetical protein
MTPAVGLDQAPIPPPSYHRTRAAALHVDACPNAGAALGVAGAMSRGRPPGPRAVPTATACWAGRCAAGLSRGVVRRYCLRHRFPDIRRRLLSRVQSEVAHVNLGA